MISAPQIDFLALEQIDQPAVELKILRRDFNLERRLPWRLSGFFALDPGKQRNIVANDLGDTQEDPAALDRPAVSPSGKSVSGGSRRR